MELTKKKKKKYHQSIPQFGGLGSEKKKGSTVSYHFTRHYIVVSTNLATVDCVTTLLLQEEVDMRMNGTTS